MLRHLQDPQANYQELPPEHELLSVVSEIAEIAGGREEPALALARKIFSRLFEVTTARYITLPELYRTLSCNCDFQ